VENNKIYIDKKELIKRFKNCYRICDGLSFIDNDNGEIVFTNKQRNVGFNEGIYECCRTLENMAKENEK